MVKGIKVIRGVGSELTTHQLEEASAQLLVSRVRGGEPQVSYTFVQRLLDELIQRRHHEERETEELAGLLVEFEEEIEPPPSSPAPDSGLDDLELLNDLEIPEEFECEFEELDLSDLETVEDQEEAEPADEEEDDEEMDIVLPSRPAPPRRALLSSRRTSWFDCVNFRRVVVIGLATAAVMAGGVFLMGCGPSRDPVVLSPAVDMVGPYPVAYLNINKEVIELSEERRQHILRSMQRSIETFEADWGVPPFVAEINVFVGPMIEENPDYAPCGILNGGGCYTMADGKVWVIAGKCDHVPHLYHELNHARLHALGEPLLRNVNHSDESWSLIYERTREIQRSCEEGEEEPR